METNTELSWLFYHIFQICVFQFWAVGKMSALSYRLTEKRNIEVAKNYLPQKPRLHSPVLDWSIGLISLTLLIYGYMNEDKYLYWSGKYLSLFGFLFSVMIVDLYVYSKYKKLIPLKNKRSADLRERKLGRIIPLWAWGLNLMAFIYYIYIRPSLKQKIASSITLLVVIGTGLYTEKRSKLPVSNEDDELYRKSEAYTVFVVACALPIVSIFKEDLKFIGLDAVFSTLPLLMFILFLNSKAYKRIIN